MTDHRSKPTGYPGGKWQPEAAKYAVSGEFSFMVSMDDGIKLYAGVYYPSDPITGEKAEGRFPVYIEETPYGLEGTTDGPIPFMVEHGYIYAMVRCRGTGKSEGEVDYFGPRDFKDGVNMVDWASKELPGSDGRVVLGGASYPGQIALGVASMLGKNSPVKAVIAASIGLNNVYREAFMSNGIPTAWLWSYMDLGPLVWGNTPAAKRFVEYYVKDTVSGGDWAYDRPNTWGEHGAIESARQIAESGIPILLWCGWRDIVEVGALRAFTALQNTYAGRDLLAPMTKGQKISPKYQIIVGNWEHAEGLNASVYLE